jgi:hypothetical protein
VRSVPVGCHGQPQSLLVTLPPLVVAVFKAPS